ncbi:MAG: TonB family protein [Halothiobacillaceae bacterium]|nr:TonB family protein [Halothiobacillaceae bacterium]
MPTQPTNRGGRARPDLPGSNRVLKAALVLAVLVHLGLLLLHFTRPEVERRPMIEISLDAPPAERSRDAGERIDTRSLDLPADPSLAGLAGQESPHDTQRETGRGPQHEGAGGASDSPRPLSTRDRIDRLYAQVNAALRTGYATSRTQGGPAGRYLARWKRQVEVYGNRHYPSALVQESLSGQVILEATIGKQGHVLNLAIRRSSGSAAVDNAARNLLQAAAPYPPFPADLAAENDRLVITRTWVFTSDRRLRNEAPASP